jgi:hypothetical protein
LRAKQSLFSVLKKEIGFAFSGLAMTKNKLSNTLPIRGKMLRILR